MDFALTTEQALLKDSVERYVAESYDFKTRCAAVATGKLDRARWIEFANNGWLAAGVAEALGGFGDAVESVLVSEAFGRGLVVEPFLGCGVLAIQLLIASGDEAQIVEWLPEALAGRRLLSAAYSEPQARGDLDHVTTKASSEGSRYRLEGGKTLVLGGSDADVYLVSARTSGDPTSPDGIGLFLVPRDAPGLGVETTPLLDGSDAATLSLSGVAAQALGDPSGGHAALACMARHGIAAIVAESVGMMDRAIDMSVEYAATRQQFGVPIGSFQAIQHKLADMAIEHEMARAVLHQTLAGFEIAEPARRTQRFNGMKLTIGDALRNVTGAAVQVHGSMGLTEEHPVGHYLKRMVVLDTILGNSAYHLSRYVQAMRELSNVMH